jgi:hypothetical protein
VGSGVGGGRVAGSVECLGGSDDGRQTSGVCGCVRAVTEESGQSWWVRWSRSEAFWQSVVGGILSAYATSVFKFGFSPSAWPYTVVGLLGALLVVLAVAVLKRYRYLGRHGMSVPATRASIQTFRRRRRRPWLGSPRPALYLAAAAAGALMVNVVTAGTPPAKGDPPVPVVEDGGFFTPFYAGYLAP